MKNTPHPESGNIAFIILLAVALFAALSFIMTQNRDSNTSLMTDQQAKIAAQEIISYGSTLAAAIQKLKLSGCADNQFDFSNSIWQFGSNNPIHPTGHNPNAPAEGCSLFLTAKGNVIPITLPTSSCINAVIGPTNTKLGHFRVNIAAVPGIGNAAQEDVILVSQRLKENVCAKINDILGVENPSGTPPSFSASHTWPYQGSFGHGVSLTDNSGGNITGKTAYCGNRGGLFEYNQILIAR